MIRTLTSSSVDFNSILSNLLAYESAHNSEVIQTVDTIISQIRSRGDSALIEYTNTFDRTSFTSGAELIIPAETLKQKFESLSTELKESLVTAKERIEAFHQRQTQQSWQITETDGTKLGQKITPLDKVGLYVPGGKASYPSSVLMNAIPAKVAGVETLIMVVPTPDGEVNDIVLAAAYICNVDMVCAVGGAQAVAALAYGTQTIPAVDKIVGPGNIYVATAKRAVFGKVGIDMIAGPSEILIICDGKTNPDWIAMDLFSQAEHDEDAQAILLTDDAQFLQQVKDSIAKLLPTMKRKDIIETSLRERGALILTQSMDEAVEISNRIAPEHLELSVANPETMLEHITHAGAIFMGRNTCESLGDYCAGPNHVLPTSGTARFSSPLGVDDFVKKSSTIMVSDAGAITLGNIAATLADSEGLDAHARSARYRVLE